MDKEMEEKLEQLLARFGRKPDKANDDAIDYSDHR